MRLISLTAAGAIVLSGCSSQKLTEPTGGTSYLCVPDPYAVVIGEANTLAPGYHWPDGAYDTSILIEAEEMTRLVPGYIAQTRTGGQPRKQPLYVMVAPGPDALEDVPDPGSMQPFLQPTTQSEAVSQLARADPALPTWQVAELSDGDATHWGTCTSQFTQPDSFNCQRDLTVEGLGLTYTLHEDNLHLYPAIDEALRQKLDQWRCDSGEIRID